jgi:hypothetical protein
MVEFDTFEVGDLVFSNEDHPHLNVDGESPGLVVDVVEDTFGEQVEVAVEFYPDHNEVRFAAHELTIVGREGELTTIGDVKEGDRIMMISPDGELIKVLVEDVYRGAGVADIYGVESDDDLESVNFILSEDTDVFKVSA